MSTVLKVITTRAGKYFGETLPAEADVTASFEPQNRTHLRLVQTGRLRILSAVDETSGTAPAKKSAAKSKR